ncbi:zinc finger protein 2 [Angomonas deanei]|uniref:WW domain/Zinc finger C-x8-C-x5-C-x3-H type (And similar), putative n=1 Tax=Angomonas deanei TaxID=59799 RepID=A0A7G2C9X6_9TRYP|nr:zinc finger protein 2 [Angomonas deanei]CAD2216255.1 WW domain/Zinc finger C-x8-C-x5-C-x3-H type (and similar), putative [Angomonas deanei]|eukprot:EPY22351.1 zinc finger protein 2 [Angomonas deanei]
MAYRVRGRGGRGGGGYGYGSRGGRGLRYRGRGYGRSHAPPAARSNLPEGWQLAYTEDGETYYVDHNTKTTHWSLPKEVQEKAKEQKEAPARGRGRGRGASRGGYRGGRGYYRGGGGYHSHYSRFSGVDKKKTKTKMCMNIENGGTCPFGDKCAFAHSPDELKGDNSAE